MNGLDRVPVIGVTASGSSSNSGSQRVTCSRTYLDTVEAAGGAPFCIPPMGESTLRALFEAADGLLLPGGGDVAPHYYGEEPLPELGSVEDDRDAAELLLARWALEEGKPTLAICRGIQVLNVAAGGTLYQDLPTQYGVELDHLESTRRKARAHIAHGLDVVPNTRLAEAVGPGRHPVNSHHHQAIKDLGRGLLVTGRSEDGLIESVESESAPWVVGVQCHPEELWQEHEWALSLFRAFVREAAFRPREPRVIGALRRPERA